MKKEDPLRILKQAITDYGGSSKDIAFLDTDIAKKIVPELVWKGLQKRTKHEAYIFRPYANHSTMPQKKEVVEFVPVKSRDHETILAELDKKGYRPISQDDLDTMGRQNAKLLDHSRNELRRKERSLVVLALDNEDGKRFSFMEWCNQGQAYPCPYIYFSSHYIEFENYLAEHPFTRRDDPMRVAAIRKKQ